MIDAGRLQLDVFADEINDVNFIFNKLRIRHIAWQVSPCYHSDTSMQLPPGSIIAVGPVIIEEGNVLLNREKKDDGISPWFFPGGGVENFDLDLEETCRREVKEEMGIEIELLKPLRTLMVKRPDKDGYAILVHYLAKRIGGIAPGPFIAEWGWHDMKNLPDNCAPNVIQIVSDLNNIYSN